MDREQFRLRFPTMRPIAKAPMLYRINGCGLAMYGKREVDHETGTYLKTRCLTLAFVPVLAIDTYRVADADHGWHFIGKDRLSPFALAWDVLATAGLVFAIAWGRYQDYLDSPAHRAHERFAAAQALGAAGDWPRAAAGYTALMDGGDATDEAHAALADLVSARLDRLPPPQGLEILNAVAAVRAMQREPELLDATLEQHARTLIALARADQPRTAIGLVDLCRRLLARQVRKPTAGTRPAGEDPPTTTPADAALAADRETLLVACAAQAPDDPWPAVELAVAAEQRGDAQRCQELLEPHASRLGTTEGARILGSRYAALGRNDDAYPLLAAYTGARLAALRVAESAYDAAYQHAWDQAAKRLDAGDATTTWYAARDRMGAAQQQQANDAWIGARVRADVDLQRRQAALAAAATVVPVAMDLGIVTLQRAQLLTDPVAKKRELEAAEHTFLSIRGVAGKDDQYRLSLAEVYYWLGKPGDARALLDQLLADRKRAFASLMAVTRTLRMVGADSESRALAEEAYAAAGDDDGKHEAAELRALVSSDYADEILWLERCDQQQSGIAANLAEARGRQAAADGRDAEAATLLRRAVDLWTGMAPTATTLNNGALAVLALFDCTGERALLTQGQRMLAEAFALDPGDSILLKNEADLVLKGLFMDVIGSRLDLHRLGHSGRMWMLRFLYQDEAGRATLSAAVAAHPDLPRALALFEKLTVMRPKDDDGWQALSGLQLLARDVTAARSLQQRLAGVDLDDGSSTGGGGGGGAAPVETQEQRDAKRRTEMLAELRRPEQLVAALRSAGGATFAIAAWQRFDRLQDLAAHGGPELPEDLITSAEQAYATAPSVGSCQALVEALLLRCTRALAARDPAAAELLADYRRTLAPHVMLPVLLELAPGRVAGLRGDADFMRACTLLQTSSAAFPFPPSGWTWALLRWTSADEGAAMAAALRADQLAPIATGLAVTFDPYSGEETLEAWWLQRARGDAVAAQAILAAAKARSLWLPVPPP